MGIDHGLGGKDGIKSKERRAKKAKKIRTIALNALTGGKKREVIFDEQARTQYLTGFGKRKQERRKYGLAMEVLKKNKAHKDMVKEQRNAFKETNDFKTIPSYEDNQDDEEDDEQIVNTYEDPSTISMFGSSVSVVVNTSINLNDTEENSNNITKTYNTNSNNHHKTNNNQRKELSKLDKALKIAKVKMSSKKKHKDTSKHGKLRSVALNKKVESSKLLNKAIGKHKIKATSSSNGKRHR